MKASSFKPYKAWKKIFPKIKFKEGMYVKCVDGRKREGFLLGRIKDIFVYPLVTLRVETVPQWIDKRDITVMHLITKSEYEQWARKEWEFRGLYPIKVKGSEMYLTKLQIKFVKKQLQKICLKEGK